MANRNDATMTNRNDAPFYIVFCGVNGAGKTTLFHSSLWKCEGVPKSIERINPDEILRENGGDWQNINQQTQAGKIALERINELFAKRKSFNQETTLTGHLALQNIKRAKQLGYRVFLYYVGVNSVETALNRIAHRVSLGGHSIDEQIVKRRFHSSLINFSYALDYCEQAIVFDNTQEFVQLAMWENSTLVWWGNPNVHGPWLVNAMQSDEWRANCN
jgi:predicted ABC-type ATPase